MYPDEADISLAESMGENGIFQHIALGQWEKQLPVGPLNVKYF